MTDIVELCRSVPKELVWANPDEKNWYFGWKWLREAADEIERRRAENQELKLQYLSDQGQWIEETGRLRAALRKWDALIQYQYNGSREAMSALQECAFETDAILKGYALGEKE